jgi:hypothetical protein
MMSDDLNKEEADLKKEKGEGLNEECMIDDNSKHRNRA